MAVQELAHANSIGRLLALLDDEVIPRLVVHDGGDLARALGDLVRRVRHNE